MTKPRTFWCRITRGCLAGGVRCDPGEQVQLSAVDAADLLASGRSELCDANERAELHAEVNRLTIAHERRNGFNKARPAFHWERQVR